MNGQEYLQARKLPPTAPKDLRWQYVGYKLMLPDDEDDLMHLEIDGKVYPLQYHWGNAMWLPLLRNQDELVYFDGLAREAAANLWMNLYILGIEKKVSLIDASYKGSNAYIQLTEKYKDLLTEVRR